MMDRILHNSIIPQLLLLSCTLILFNTSCGTTNKGPRKKRAKSEQQISPERQAILEAHKGNYPKAIKMLTELIGQQPQNMDLYARRGTFAYESGAKEKALENFNHIIQNKPNYNPEIYYSAGRTAMDLNQYKLASDYFDYYVTNQKENPKKVAKAKSLLETSLFRKGVKNEDYDIDPQPLVGNVNSQHSEYLPALTLDQNQMIFTRRLGGQEDLYIATKSEDGWIDSKEIEGVNTMGNEAAHTISSDGKTIIFTACDRRFGVGGCDLYITRLKSNGWSKPTVMNTNINTPAWEAQPCLSADGRKLFFCSSRVEGNGGHDIWVSTKDENGRWMPAENLGLKINTDKSEESPFLHPDGKTLYFRSNGHPGMGSFDLYKTEFNATKAEWSEPENLGPPINTVGNEGALSISIDGSKGYYASDIFSLKRKDPRPNLDILQFNVPLHLRPSPVTFVKAKIIDALTQQPIEAEVVLENQKTKESQKEFVSKDGDFIFALPEGEKYAFSVDKPGYVYFLDLLDLESSNTVYDAQEVIIALQPIDKESTKVEDIKPIILKHIYFASGSADLLPDSDYEVSKLHQLMAKQPSVRIKILGHTDDIGSEADNLALSQKRSESLRNALVAKGINANRIEAVGKGESNPIASNDSEDGRSQNRRTEVIIYY